MTTQYVEKEGPRSGSEQGLPQIKNTSIKWPIVGTTGVFLSEVSTEAFMISLVFCFI